MIITTRRLVIVSKRGKKGGEKETVGGTIFILRLSYSAVFSVLSRLAFRRICKRTDAVGIRYLTQTYGPNDIQSRKVVCKVDVSNLLH